jgi:hypothetical protein
VSKGLNMVEKDKDWKSFFAETVDDTLKQIFKEDGARVIYEFLENHTRLRLEEVADKPEVFSEGLERLMVSAARVIEKVILKNLYSRMGLTFKEKPGYEFQDYIREQRGRE